MQQPQPLFGPVGELAPLGLAVGLVVLWLCWPQIRAALSGLWPTRRRVARGRERPSPVARRPSILEGQPRRIRRAEPRQLAAPKSGTKLSQSTPAEAQAAPADPTPTRSAVEALPAVVPWPLDQTQLDRLPVLHDGRRWRCLDATASRHAVICGASRSGKGNLLQILALEVLTQGPERAQVWVLDPKGGLDYQELRHLAHGRVYADVVAGENPFDGDLSAGYQAALDELGRRNQLLLSARARNHHEYRMRSGQALPYLVLICDEVAELSGPQQKALATLARMSAAAGMVIWAATQYPTVESLPSQVQANALDRVVFQFPSPRYTSVALGLAQGERPRWEPSAIGERGVAILRQDGADVAIGRVHHLTDATAGAVLRALRSRYPRERASVTPQQDAVTGNVPTPATTPVTGPEGPELEVLRASEASPVTGADREQDRDDLVLRLAREGLSVRKVREELTSRGYTIRQDRLMELHRQGRAQAAQQQPADDDSPPAADSAEPTKPDAPGASPLGGAAAIAAA